MPANWGQLTRLTKGDDRMVTFTYGGFAQEFERAFGNTGNNTYPPYNVVKVDDDKIVMEFAVAGFKKNDISITTEKNVLTIKAEQPETDEKAYLHKGIAARKFTRAFTLPEYFEVESAEFEYGILYIDLIRNIPEEKKPKKITIN
jgi:molecular chaperone IbpA